MNVPVQKITSLRKRDGRVVSFNLDKIADAINKSFLATLQQDKKSLSYALAEEVYAILEDGNDSAPDVEHVQDVVEQVLMHKGHDAAAKAYMLYRAERSRIREMNTRLMKTYEDLTFRPAEDSDIKRENANIDGDTAMGTMLKYGSEGSKQFTEMFVLDPVHSRAHRDGDVHIHDLDFYSLTTTCCQIDLVKLFKDGFSTGHGALREPANITSYAALCCIAIQSNQNDQHGGQSVFNFDYGMAMGVKKSFVITYRDNIFRALELLADVTPAKIDWPKDLKPCMGGNPEYKAAEHEVLLKLVPDEAIVDHIQSFTQRQAEKEIDRLTYKAMVAIVHNLNTMHSRAGAQTPFSSINYGLDTSPEGRLVIKNLLLATESGLGHGETPIFPIQIFRVKEGVNSEPEDISYDLFKLACRVSAKRLFPNFSFMDAPFNAKYYKGTPETEISYMGCRTRVVGNVHDPEREVVGGRGNLSYTSLNLPRIAINARRTAGDNAHLAKTLFFQEMDTKISLIIDQLYARFSIQAHKKVRNFPFLMGQHVWLDSEKLGWDDEVGEVLKHGTLTIGFIGLAETLTALIGEHHGQSKEAQELGLKIVGHMRKRMDEESEKSKLNFTLIATPAEGLSGRFVRLDQKKYGIIPGVTDKEYYTNSFHVPVGYDITAYDKIHLEAPYHALTNAGHITYIEMDGDPLQNLDAFERVIKEMQHSGVGYGSVNHPVDRDPVCGFSGIITKKCPGCGRSEVHSVPFERIRRITGYLAGTLDRFNNAKRAEVRDRVTHG